MYEWPLINDNISEDDKDKLVEFIKTPGARFTQHENVRKFEEEWSAWLGANHTTYVNSGASANWIMASKHSKTPLTICLNWPLVEPLLALGSILLKVMQKK